MNISNRLITGGALTIASSLALAGTHPYFNPLTQSSAVATPGHINELKSPWQTPAGISQENLTSMVEIEADMSQSVVREKGLSTGASMWDMVAYDPTGQYIFIPHETATTAGVSRYSIADDTTEVLFSGDGSGNWDYDFGAFDPATFTPYGTVLLGEEWSGQGRVLEVLNPYADVSDIQVREKNSFANVSQEGIRFGTVYEDTVYYVDEDYSGSIYKLVADDETFDSGQTFVLVVEGFEGDSSDRGLSGTRVGAAHWQPLTDEQGNPLTAQDPFDNNAGRAGRIAADEIGGTPYARPEDIEVGVLANGNEVLYFAATAELRVYSVEMHDRTDATVRIFAGETETPKNLGFAATTGVIDSPDNLAQDALGNIYVIEDWPNGDIVGGDIWFLRDADNDGVAESVDHFMSMQVNGAEATGMIFNPVEPTQFVVSIQHPSTTGIEGGQGDALWTFDITDVVPPTCEKSNRYNEYSFKKGKTIRTCSESDDANFIDALVSVDDDRGHGKGHGYGKDKSNNGKSKGKNGR